MHRHGIGARLGSPRAVLVTDRALERRRVPAVLSACLWLSACAAADAPIEEAEPRDATQVADLRVSRALAAQPLPFDEALSVTLSKRAPTALFTFALSAAAHVEIHVRGAAGALGFAPNISLFPLGSSHASPRGESTGRPTSRSVVLRSALAAGQYVVSLHAPAHPPHGKVMLLATCTGAGCPEPSSACLFGETFGDRNMQAGLQVTDEQWLHSPADLEDDVARAQVVAALQQSSHTDVTTAAAAFAAADEGVLRRVQLLRVRTDERYVAWEYGAGDNSYGAYFRARDSRVLAAIHDGDIIDCSVSP